MNNHSFPRPFGRVDDNLLRCVACGTLVPIEDAGEFFSGMAEICRCKSCMARRKIHEKALFQAEEVKP